MSKEKGSDIGQERRKKAGATGKEERIRQKI